MKKIFILSFALCQIMLAVNGDTQEDVEIDLSINNNQKYSLENVVATGSALKSDVVNIPGNISVIESNKIRKTANTKISDIVKKSAGVRIDNDVSFNPRPKIRIRGINYGTLILLDGLILSDLEGENRIINQIFLEDVERVEIARGSYSSLYGTGAIGGVIHFITAMPNEFEVRASIGYGNELQKGVADKNVVRLYGLIGGSLLDKRLRLKFNFGYKRSDGYSSFPTYFAKGSTTVTNASTPVTGFIIDKAGQTIIGTGGDRAYNIYDTRIKAEYDISDNDMLSAMIGLSSYDYEFKNPISFLRKQKTGKPTNLIDGKDYFVGSGLGGRGRYSHIYGTLSYTHSFEDSILKVSLQSMNLLSIWQDALQGSGDRNGGPGTTQDIDSTSNYLDIIYQTQVFDSHKISSGIQFRYYGYVQAQRDMTNWLDNSTRTTNRIKFGQQAFVGSFYTNWEAQWFDNFNTNLGIRYDYWRNFNGYIINNLVMPNTTQNDIKNYESIFSPKFSVSYFPFSFLLIKSSIGTGFRMPTIRDMYQFTHASNFWALNPDLKKESAISFDIGAELNTKYLIGSIYYYQLEMKDMIYRSGSGKMNDPWRFINAGKGRVNGIELNMLIPLFLSDLSLEANYTLTNAVILKNAARPQSVGKQLVGLPKHMLNISLNYIPKYGFYASLWAYYTPPFYNDDANSTPISYTYGYYDSQFTLNAKLGYTWRMGLDLSVSFNNITNNRYYDFYQVEGANFYAQLSYKYKGK
ncbi:TonB-dependent receptor [Helicobacter muridarum]|uniref:TonB-dependent receptor n=1 Tax=Helicobacter muridarum TaxID=216 RepID=A0A099TZE9_9HELI|nr:TonB-dependent receptor [Helicobacter muridarum]TLD99550.1 TonB-dependent receptor [Helicobacter muridarum]STQ85884.1 TonB-dependent receptor protein [Helicobacter muridarum]